MIFEFQDIKLGDTVMYLEKRPFGGASESYVPAIVEQIFPLKPGEDFPDLGLMVIVNGFHVPTVGYPRRPHGTKTGEWLTFAEAKAFYAKEQADKAAQKKASDEATLKANPPSVEPEVAPPAEPIKKDKSSKT